MKRFVHAAEEAILDIHDNASLVAFLQSKGIDTTKNKYKLTWVFYDRFDTESYTATFTCPGDYLALFSTRIASYGAIPNYANLVDFYGSIDDVIDIVNDNPTYDALYKYGENKGWFWREEYGNIKLKNLSTGTVLVEDQDEGEWYGYEEEWED